jgi:hypothetical protein
MTKIAQKHEVGNAISLGWELRCSIDTTEIIAELTACLLFISFRH